MKIITPNYYKDFKCIAGDCPDSCCQGWEVDSDAESLAFYASLDPTLEIKKKIDTVLDKDEFGNTIFNLAPKKRCPFLNDENLCDMHIAIGGEHTPYTCRTFPRFIYDFGAVREIGVSFSCPVAADMIFALDKWEFDEENNDLPPALNEIDGLEYIRLKNARNSILEALQNRELHIKDRLLKMLEICSFLQEENNGTDSIDFFDVFRNPELINPEWEDKVNKASVKEIQNTVFNENIAIYFIYKYFLSSVLDDDFSPLFAAKMAVIGVLINSYIGGDAWTMHLWSKETEHSQYNMDRYVRLLNSAQCLTLDALKNKLK